MDHRFVLLATAFGAGEHFAHVLAAWRRRTAASPVRAADGPRALDWHTASALHYIAVLPALPPAAALAITELRPQWPVDVPGFHRLSLDGGNVTLDLLVGEPGQSLQQLQARVDALYLPQPVNDLRTVAKLALPGATLAMQGSSDDDLKALRSAGFTQQSCDAPACPWLGDASEVTCATFTSRKPQPPRAPIPERRAIVIGAGMAGAAMCERLAARDWDLTLIERHGLPAQEASGNRSGIFMPLLSRDDNIPTRLARAAYLYAQRRWQALGGLHPDAQVGADAVGPIAGSQCGVLQLARDAQHADLQREVVDAWRYPAAYVRWVDAQEASGMLGVATPDGGWLFPQGGWANPGSICRAMLDACGKRLTRIHHAEAMTLQRTGGQWQVLDAQGQLLAQAPNVILANSAGARSLAQTAELPLYTMRGQVTHVDAQAFPAVPLVVCREAYITPAVHGIVSAGATYDTDTDAALRVASQQENLARAADILPGALDRLTDTAPLAGRVAFRCMAPDRLPLVGALPDYSAAAGKIERLRDVPRHPGLYGVLAYASRGLIWAPLAAEILAAQLEHEPLPLETTLIAALDPGRFMLKAQRKSPAVEQGMA
ncbi:FAD-dependent 5-carboxymethylaminomethyl-2-thiouridine(34) oxidoreductase MnmC [Duganella sp. FT92W]|uniref:FAD-dependent 5-carboxymethylaminomethyl-2-thiouridine(34) oxidoreductase MnmC n=1 Tax=Pseudoduganella rivuli TaxID=2666085 RepID=A0A7X2LUD4_9BURK|nr:FAD-dependent 5-carboxymethylaminomethyl-2-thiouridine(34) oxidoreductase MnmC [Pseudoduganella rivuli]MRV72932.1 FAD-dependent 5-carboxymethylaminomethyl-2-thiouridine(34) oxidoreductase MnmC [Pseudoduganella rivuli]